MKWRKNMYIKKNQLKNWENVTNTTLNHYFYQNYESIKQLDIIPLLNKKVRIKSVFDTFGYEHHCEILLVGNEIEKHQCDCQWHTPKNACPHILRLAYEINQINLKDKAYHEENEIQSIHETKRKNYAQYKIERKRALLVQNSRKMIEKFKAEYENQLQIAINDQPIEIEAILHYSYNTFTFSFRLGLKKKYMIKDIHDFLRRIDYQESFYYGKDLELKHRIEYFDEFAQKQIQFMRQHLNDPIPYAFAQDKKLLYINDLSFDDFIELYENNIGKNFDVQISEEKPILELKKMNDLYTLSLKEQNCILAKKHLYKLIEQYNFYHILKYPLDEMGKTAQVIHSLIEEELVLDEKDFEQFHKYVLADILPYIELQGDMEEVCTPYDQILCYGEINEEGKVCISLKYSDGENEIDGFDPNHLTNYKQDLCESYILKHAAYLDEEKHQAIFNNNDQTYDFVQVGFPYLSKLAQVFVSDELKTLTHHKKYSISVGIRLNNHLLEIDMDSLTIPKEELGDVLKAYHRKKKFYRLKNGELLLLENDELKELDQFMEDYHIKEDDLVKGKTQLQSYRMFGMNYAEQQAQNITISCDSTIKNQIQRFDQFVQQQIPILPKYDEILRDYQKEGVTWLHLLHEMGFNGILADDMGLGKTLQVIAFLEGLSSSKTSMVICPSSLVYNWESEVLKFSHALKVLCIVGNQAQREALIQQFDQYDLIVTSYDYIRRDIQLYQDKSFNYVILDEAQYIKNQKTKNAISVKQLQCDHRLALSGTPIENSLAELWSIFDFLMPDYLFSYHYFQTHYESEIVRYENDEQQQKLKKLVSPFILRRNKKDVLKELPDKIERVSLIDFNEEENKLYMAHLAQVHNELNSGNLQNKDKIEILAMLTRLRQLCCEPRAIFDNIQTPSSKLSACMELIQTIHENNQKCLLFSSFTTMLDFIAQELKKAHISYYMLTGKTSKEERKKLVEAYQNDDTCVFLISLKAGGTGLNLTAAEAVIHFDPWWNQSAQNQATDRAYRIGQNKNVQVFELVMKNSIEEKIQKLKAKKKELADAIVENNESSLKAMSKEELMELFTMD